MLIKFILNIQAIQFWVAAIKITSGKTPVFLCFGVWYSVIMGLIRFTPRIKLNLNIHKPQVINELQLQLIFVRLKG